MKRARPDRPRRLAALIQESLGRHLTRDVRDPRIGFVTVTGVEVAPDASVATIRVSVMGSDDEKNAAVQGLESARGYLRTQLAQELKLRNTPELRFRLDRGLEHARRINELLSQLHPEE